MALPNDGVISATSITTAEFRTAIDSVVSEIAKGTADYVSTRSYSEFSEVKGSDGKIYVSQSDGNIGNDPTVDDGSNWKPTDEYRNNAIIGDTGYLGYWSEARKNSAVAGELVRNNGVFWEARAPIADISAAAPTDVLWIDCGADGATFKHLADACASNRDLSAGFEILSYHDGLNAGGGKFTAATGRHNGGTFIDLSRTFPSDWDNETQKTAWFLDSGVDVSGFESLDKTVTPETFGAKGDYNGTSGSLDAQSVKAWLESNYVLEGTQDQWYWLGEIAGDASLATRGYDLIFDGNGAKFSCSGDTSGTFTATSLVSLTDRKVSARNFWFDDESFASRGSGRGVVPISVLGVSGETVGFYLDSIQIKRGQSFGTFFCSDKTTARLKSISVKGCVATDDCERGVTLGGCENVTLDYTLPSFVRAAYVQDSKDVRGVIVAGVGASSSGNILIVSSTSGYECEDIDIKITAETLSSITAITDASGLSLKNIKLDVMSENVTDVNTEVVRIGQQDGAGNYVSTGDIETSGIDIKTRFSVDCVEMAVATISPNNGLITTDTKGDYTGYKGGASTVFASRGLFEATRVHDVSSDFSMPFADIFKSPANISCRLDVQVRSGLQYKDQGFWLQGSIASNGDITIVQTTSLYSAPVGGPNPTITISSSGNNLLVSCDTYMGDVTTKVKVSNI